MQKIFLVVCGEVLFLLTACEELKPRRVREFERTYDHAMTDYNNGDSSSIIILIVSIVIIGLLWLWINKDKLK